MPRIKKLTDYTYSPTNPASEDAIRGQIDDSIQEVYDFTSTTGLTSDNTHEAIDEVYTKAKAIVPVLEITEARTSSTYGTFSTLKERTDNSDFKIRDFAVNVKDFGATGGLDDSVAFQAANDYLNSSGGGILFIPSGIWNANFILDSKITIKGSGVNATVLKSVSGSDKDVIQGRNFMSLTNTAKETPENRGVRYISIKNITIDGNKSNNTSGYGIRIWGCSWTWENVIVQNCANDGIWTEFTTHDDPTGNPDPSSQALESDFKFIKSLGNNGNGWTYNGPHDSILNNYTAFSNTGWALYQAKGTLFGSVWNSWLNGTGSYYVGDSLQVHKLTASAGYIGTGVEFKAGVGACMLTALIIGGHPTGIILRGSDHIIDGYIRNARNSANDSGDGIILDGTINCKVSMVATGCHNFIKKISEAQGNYITGIVNVPAGKTLNSGPAFASQDYINIGTALGSDISKIIFQIPTTSILVGGWNPKLPLSNGTIITDTTLPTATLRGGIKQQPAIANLTVDPTFNDFNDLLSKLRTAGVIAQS